MGELRALGYIGDIDEIARHDPRLVEVVRTVGSENLDIQEVPMIGGKATYRVTENDGWERVETPADGEWVVVDLNDDGYDPPGCKGAMN
jgi:hypothetical protein